MASLMTLYDFGLESTLLFPSLTTTTSGLPRQANANNVLDIIKFPLPIRKRQARSKLAAIGEQPPPPSQTIPCCEAEYNRVISQISGNRQQPVLRQIGNVTATADKPDSETTSSVSPSSESLDIGGSAATRSAVRTSSSSGELTTTSFYAVSASASDVDETSPLTPTTPTTGPPSNVPAEIDVTTSGFRSAITLPHASITPSAISAPSSADRPFLSIAKPTSTSLSSPASSETSFTESHIIVPSVTSSTEISSITILSTRNTSTRGTWNSVSLTSISSATVSGSSVSAFPHTTGRTTTFSTPGPSSPPTASWSSTSTIGTPATVSPLSTYVPGTASSTVSSSSAYSSSKTSHTCSATHSKMSTTILSSTTLSSTFMWTTLSPSSTSSSNSHSSTFTSRTWTYSAFPSPQSSSSTNSSRTASGSFTTSRSSTTMAIAPGPTFNNGTSSTISETVSLRTDTPHVSAFARNTGAVISVSAAATIALICLVLLLFFTCRRHRRPRVYTGSTDNILTLAREVSWRRPVDGDDDLYTEKTRTFPPPSSLEHSVDTHDAFGSTSAGEYLSSGHGSAESGNATIVMPMNVVFGEQSPGLDQSIQGAVALPPNAMIAPFLSEPHNVLQGSSNPYRFFHTGGTGSTVTVAGEPSYSREETGSLSSTEETSTRPDGKRRTLLGPRPMGLKTSHRHSSTPPTAFTNIRQPLFDYERQPEPLEQSDRMSVKSFISRLRNGRTTSAQSVSTIGGPSSSQTRETEVPGTPSIAVFSPSLLNPPVTIMPPQPALTFPRGVTGNSYSLLESQTGDEPPDGSNCLSVLWPPATLPPSPSPTEHSILAEGLLDPKLSLAQGQSHQASMTSLRDHEDYTRPINGLVNNHLRSTTTFGTQDTIDSEGGKDSIRS